MRSEVRKRSQIIAVRVTPEERERFAELAARYGWSLPHLMRLGIEAALLSDAMRSAEQATTGAAQAINTANEILDGVGR